MRIAGIIASATMLVLSLLGWIFLSAPAVAVRLAPFGVDMMLPAAVLPVIGLFAGVALSTAVMLVGGRGRGESAAAADSPAVDLAPALDEAGAQAASLVPPDRVALILGAAFAGIVALLFVAVVQEQIKALPAALVLICGTLALLAGSYAMDGLVRGDAIEISSHWGGLGGGLGGWRLSPISTLLLLALVFLGATIAAGVERSPQAGTSNGGVSNTAAPEPPPTRPAAAQSPATGAAPVGDEAAANGAVANQAGAR